MPVPENLTGQGSVILSGDLCFVAKPRGRVLLDRVDLDLRRVIPRVVDLTIERYVGDVSLAGLAPCDSGCGGNSAGENSGSGRRGDRSDKLFFSWCLQSFLNSVKKS